MAVFQKILLHIFIGLSSVLCFFLGGTPCGAWKSNPVLRIAPGGAIVPEGPCGTEDKLGFQHEKHVLSSFSNLSSPMFILSFSLLKWGPKFTEALLCICALQFRNRWTLHIILEVDMITLVLEGRQLEITNIK